MLADCLLYLHADCIANPENHAEVCVVNTDTAQVEIRLLEQNDRLLKGAWHFNSLFRVNLIYKWRTGQQGIGIGEGENSIVNLVKRNLQKPLLAKDNI